MKREEINREGDKKEESERGGERKTRRDTV